MVKSVAPHLHPCTKTELSCQPCSFGWHSRAWHVAGTPGSKVCHLETDIKYLQSQTTTLQSCLC